LAVDAPTQQGGTIMNSQNVRKRWVSWVSAAVVAASLSGCSSFKTWPTTYSAKASGSWAKETATVFKGEKLTVRLPTVWGSARSWRLTPESFSNGYLSLQTRTPQVLESGSTGRNGEPAWDVFVFKASHSGQVPLEFIYDTPWTPDPASSKRLVLDVGVVKPGEGDSSMVDAQPTEQ
jgi:predicted secreted protein